jgi:coatomer protein complex subunit alpha (xenin)
LYLLTGNLDKLRKMLKIAEMRGDVMSRFHNALFLGDVSERVGVFGATGQISLAYLTAKTYGLDDEADRYQQLLEAAEVPLPALNPRASILQPPTPIFKGENWPLLQVSKPSMEKAAGGISAGIAEDDFHDAGDGGQWAGDDDDLFDDEDGEKPKKKETKAAPTAAAGGWGGEDDLDLSDDEPEVPVAKAVKGAGNAYVAPQAGTTPTSAWCSGM